MKFIEYMKENYSDLKGKYKTLHVLDADAVRGVDIDLEGQKELDGILYDNPVRVYLAFEVVEADGDKITVKATTDGYFYLFDCMGLIFDSRLSGLPDNLIWAEYFRDDKEAVKFGANYEATVIKYGFQGEERTFYKVLYDPM